VARLDTADGKSAVENQIELTSTLQRQTILALNKLGQVVTSSLSLQEVLVRIMDEVTSLLHPEGVAILMPEDDDKLKFVAVRGHGAAHLKDSVMPRDSGVAGFVMTTGEAVWLNQHGSNITGLSIYREIEADSEFHSESLLAAPLLIGGETIGVLEAAHSSPDRLSGDDLPALAAAANWAAIAISNAQLHEQAQALRQQQALLEERARLARELHDAVTQSLYSMSVLAGAWRRQIEAGQLAPQLDHIAELGQLAQHALREVRLLIYELRPTELEEEGLLGALYRRLETVEQRAGIQARLIVTDEAGHPYPLPTDGRAAMVEFYRLPPALEQGLYRIAQEALNNSLKHSGASAVIVRMRIGPRSLSLEIEDNGRGFDADSRPRMGGGFGLTGLKERARQLGGYLAIASSPAGGTTIRVTDIPYRPLVAEEFER
jgi:signal transduction histidine kinase